MIAERFDIHSSTIIRTEESKAMGAKFLNDEEVSSAEACLKLCCETTDCDVFIYEEKVNTERELRTFAGHCRWIIIANAGRDGQKICLHA